MTAKYYRSGHYRTNVQGTTFWVSEHKVEKEFFSVHTEKGQVFINGIIKLREERCRYCYNQVFCAEVNSSKKIYFSNNKEPLVRHDCRKYKNSNIEKTGPLRKPKKFMSDSEVAAQEAAKKIKPNISEIKLNKKLSEKSINKLLNQLKKLAELISSTENKQVKNQYQVEFNEKSDLLKKI